MEFWSTLANGLVGLLSACIGAYYTLWLQAKKERVKRQDHETLYVEYSVIKTDTEGFYIPGYGRIISIAYAPVTETDRKDGIGRKRPPMKSELPRPKSGSKNIAYICRKCSSIGSEVPQYFIGHIVPL